MLLLLLLPSVFAADPSVKAAFTLGADPVDLGSLAGGGSLPRWVGARTAGDWVDLFDTLTWDDPVSVSVGCEGGEGPDGHAGGVAFTGSDVSPRLWTGCADGTVRWFDRSAGLWSETGSVSAASNGIYGLFSPDGASIFGVSGPSSAPVLFELDPDSGAVTTLAALSYSGFTDLSGDLSYLLVGQGSEGVAALSYAGGTGNQGIGSGVTVRDLLVPTNELYLLAGGEAGVLRFFPTETSGSNLTVLSNDPSDAAALSLHDASTLLVADDGAADLIGYAYSSGSLTGEELFSLAYPGSGDVVELVGGSGYTVGAALTGDGNDNLWVITDKPWVEAEVDSLSADAGGTVNLSFQSDETGTWSIYGLDASGARLSDTALATGDLGDTLSGTAAVVLDPTLFLTDTPGPDGTTTYYLQVEVTGSGERVGADAVSLSVGGDPTRPEIELAFGEERLIVDATAENTVRFEVYVTRKEDEAEFTPFLEECGAGGSDTGAASDCGPTFSVDGDDAAEYPKSQEVEVGSAVRFTVAPLENDHEYCVAVRGFGSDGQESPMSEILCEIPRKTYTFEERTGGAPGWCGAPLPVSGLAAAAGVALAVSRRRRRAAAGLGLLALIGLTTSSAPAAAAEKSVLGDKFDSHSNFQIRYGSASFDDPDVTAGLEDDSNRMLWLEGGPHIIKYFEPTLAFGFMQGAGMQTDSKGILSGDFDTLTVFPIALKATGRLDVLDDQILVPYVGLGLDYWLVRTHSATDGSDDTNTGGRYGWSWAWGGQLLLNNLEPERASLLQARSGIESVYATFEYRRQDVGTMQFERDGKGVVLTGDELTFGLKFDY